MSERFCTAPLPFEELVDYRLGELPPDREAAVEAHYFGCASCSRRLEELDRLGSDVAAAVRRGEVAAAVTGALVSRAEADGLRLRHYHLASGETAPCTAAPEDELIVVHLRGALAGVRSAALELESEELPGGRRQRRTLDELAVDRARDEVVLILPAALVRSYPRSRWTMRLASDDGAPLGTFMLDHTPWEELRARGGS